MVSISFCAKLIFPEMAKMQNIPQSMWEATAIRKHPEILELRERTRPLSEQDSYMRLISSGHTEAKTAIPSSVRVCQ